MFALEFFADKIPMFDLLWNALHTFVRIPVAAYVAYAATSHLSPQMQLASTLMGATIAFAAHGGKTALRAAVTPSPEPFSNMALSFGEDVGAISLTWIATQHPYVAAAVVAVLLLLIVICVALGSSFVAQPISQGCGSLDECVELSRSHMYHNVGY